MTRALVLAALAACSPPQPTLQLQLSDTPSGACPSTRCEDIEISCEMFFSMRILDPSDRNAPFISRCLPIPMRGSVERPDNLCSIRQLDLEPEELPYRDLEVQIALYPKHMVMQDPETLAYVCPTTAEFDAVDGFPIDDPNHMTPSLGGRSYYRAGDETITVRLGCKTLDDLANETCEGVARVDVTATVDDFDTRVSVGRQEAERLLVSIGQPKPQGGGFVLNSNETTELEDTPPTAPAWAGTVASLFTMPVCLAVLDDTSQSTTALTCRDANVTVSQIDMIGIRLGKESLDDILGALALASFPSAGMTVGIVVDAGTPVAGQVVAAAGSTIEYLSADRTMVTGSATSSSGVFVSRDAPFKTAFQTTRQGITATGMGGRIEGKATIVVLDVQSETMPGD